MSGPDLDPKCMTLMGINFEKKNQPKTKIHEKLPRMSTLCLLVSSADLVTTQGKNHDNCIFYKTYSNWIKLVHK